MVLTDVNIKVPDGMVMYLKPQDQHAELVRNALLLYPYISDNTIIHTDKDDLDFIENEYENRAESTLTSYSSLLYSLLQENDWEQ